MSRKASFSFEQSAAEVVFPRGRDLSGELKCSVELGKVRRVKNEMLLPYRESSAVELGDDGSAMVPSIGVEVERENHHSVFRAGVGRRRDELSAADQPFSDQLVGASGAYTVGVDFLVESVCDLRQGRVWVGREGGESGEKGVEPGIWPPFKVDAVSLCCPS